MAKKQEERKQEEQPVATPTPPRTEPHGRTEARSFASPVQWAILAICVVTLLIVLWPGRRKPAAADRIDDRIALASSMLNEGLPAEAIGEYKAALDLAVGEPARKANLCYLIGKTYFETIKDYEKALGYFARAKHYNPNHPERSKMEQWTVECLERLGRSLDARNKIAQATALRPDQLPTSGTIVAKIGNGPITMGHLDEAISHLPEPAQRRYADLKEKRNYLDDYITRRLYVDAAIRAGLNSNPKVIAELEDMRNDILAGAYLQIEIMDKITVTPEDTRAWYEAHRNEIPQTRRYELSHITVATEAEGTSVVTLVARGADFAEVARKFSIDKETRDKGGRLGTWSDRSPVPPVLSGSREVFASLNMMTKGQTSPFLKMPSGNYEIVHVDDVSSPTTPSFDEVREYALNRAKRDKFLNLQKERMEQLRKAANVVIYPDAFEEQKPKK